MWEGIWLIFQMPIAEVMCTQAGHLTGDTGTWVARWNYCWAISKYVIARIPLSLKTRCDWCTGASQCLSVVLAWRNISWYANFTKKQGGIYWHPKLANTEFAGQSGRTGQTSHVNRSDRSGQLCQIVNWTSPLRRSHRDDQNAYVEGPIWTLDERDMASESSAPR